MDVDDLSEEVSRELKKKSGKQNSIYISSTKCLRLLMPSERTEVESLFDADYAYA